MGDISVADFYTVDNETEEIVRGAVADICVRDLFAAIDAAWLGGLEIPVATTVAMHKLKKLVNLSLYPLDGTNLVLEQRVPDREPAPPSIDTWARGVVPTRQKVQSDDERFMARLGTSGSGTPSVSSYRSGKSGTRVSGATPRAQSAASTNLGSTRDREELGTPQIIELDDDRRYSQESNKMNDKFEKYRRAKKNALKNQVVAEADDEKDEFEIMKDTIENGKRNLKGKKFAIDSDGHPVPIGDVRPEDLPRYSLALSANITSFHKDDGPEIPLENRPKQDKGDKGKKKVRIAGSRSVEESYFIPSTSLATALSENITEDFQPAAGVSLRAGDRILEGPPVPADPSKPTRKQVLQRQKQKETNPDGYSNLGGDHSLDAEKSIGSLDSETLGSAAVTRTSRFTEIDPLEGGKKMKPVETTIRDPTDRELGLGPINVTGKPNPPQVPKKPSAKQQEVVRDFIGGPDKAGPRDRLPVGIQVPTNERKKLPPPESGKTSGHGMADTISVASSVKGSKGSPSKYGSDLNSHAGDNSTILTMSIASSKKEKGNVKLASAQLARELF